MNTFRTLRIKRRLTRNELATIIGVKKETLGKYESSWRVPSVNIALKLEKALGCTKDEFMEAYAFHRKENLIKYSKEIGGNR